MFREGTVSRVRVSQVRNGRLIGVFCKRTVFIKGKNSVGELSSSRGVKEWY